MKTETFSFDTQSFALLVSGSSLVSINRAAYCQYIMAFTAYFYMIVSAVFRSLICSTIQIVDKFCAGCDLPAVLRCNLPMLKSICF